MTGHMLWPGASGPYGRHAAIVPWSEVGSCILPNIYIIDCIYICMESYTWFGKHTCTCTHLGKGALEIFVINIIIFTRQRPNCGGYLGRSEILPEERVVHVAWSTEGCLEQLPRDYTASRVE